jgi:hypothetical protein
VATGQYRWRQETVQLQVPSDLDALLQRLASVTPTDVLQLQVSGSVDLAQQQRLQAALGPARARARALLVELSDLQLAPTADDVAALRADGYLGEVVAELHAGQTGASAEVARDALVLLAGLLAGASPVVSSDVQTERSAGPA